MQQQQYFSTQPSANAMPAQQMMAVMPPQHGHMVANGNMQPMVYAPTMMPAASGGQPMTQPMYQPVMQPMKAAANEERCKTAHNTIDVFMHPERELHLVASGVPDIEKLKLHTDMKYERSADLTDAEKFHFKLMPNGGEHYLNVSFNGKPVTNGKFEFAPKRLRPVHEAEAAHKAAKQQYDASLEALESLKLEAAAEEKKASNEKARVKCNSCKNSDKTKAVVPARGPHVIQTPPEAKFGPMVMSSEHPQAFPAQQPMPMAQWQQHPMMMQPMAYAGGNMAPPMYQMMPTQGMQMQAQPMYRQG